MAITSQVRTPLGFGEAMIADWQGAARQGVRAQTGRHHHRQSLVLRVISHLSGADIKTLREVVAEVIG